jgi:hypothetical protein
MVVPWAMLAFAGVIASEERFAALTVKAALPLTVPDVAEIFVVPILTPVAKPLTVIEAMAVMDDFQVTTSVTSCKLPSEKLPMALNCCVRPNGMLGVAGVTAIAVIVAEVTVRVVDPKIVPELAEIVVFPAATAFASPWVGTLALMVAAAVLEELHVTLPVRFWMLPSLYVPVAMNCCVVPGAMAGFAGVTAIELRTTFTVRLSVPVMPPTFALMMQEPVVFAVTIPPAATVATLALDELHTAVPVRSCVLPLL